MKDKKTKTKEEKIQVGLYIDLKTKDDLKKEWKKYCYVENKDISFSNFLVELIKKSLVK